MTQPEKKIMILGAGIYQVPLIRAANDMQLHTLVVSRPGSYPGIALARRFLPIDTTDIRAVVGAAREHAVAAICTTGTDVCLPSLGAVVSELKLAGPDYEAACYSQDKIAMKRRFADHGVPTARFQPCGTLVEAHAAARDIGYPVMIKAPDSSGSRGISRVTHKEEMDAAWEIARKVSPKKNILVERFLRGEEFGAQAIVRDAAVTEIFFHNDTVTEPPRPTPIGHSIPCRLSALLQKKAEEAVLSAVQALGIRNSICNVDLIARDDDVFILELGARMGATCLPETIGIYAGFDPYRHLVEMALGLKPLSTPRKDPVQPNASRLLISKRSGVLKRFDIPETVRNHPDLHRITLDAAPGDPVRAFVEGPDRIGDLMSSRYTEAGAGWRNW